MDATFDASSRGAAESPAPDFRNDGAVNPHAADTIISGLGLSFDEMRLVARRQFVGSVAAAGLIAAVAMLAAFRPAAHEPQYQSARAFPAVQQPTFVRRDNDRVAASKNSFELP